ncbi:hypothetical protein LTR70_006103 [Exophiala xenobiotica]|uniref:galacturonan 1,4-alpha-galacturonidase n=1 Tax=Lithohypha guttulata TaxID=1690604 RepID=A0ABR0K8U4_9EURO|nr:hypothetical protein LTR24_005660 [Lithohypha guttulata]KAK5316856.1 hypothetical protein LTR70_006103 [Exophiala xenobiotica]
MRTSNCLLWLAASLCFDLATASPVKPTVDPSNRPSCVPAESPARNKICYVDSHNDQLTDDSNYILSALHECNNGGHVVFPANQSYLIGTALDLTFLQHVDLDIQGDILFSDDTDYWQANAFQQVFQNATTFFQLGGKDVNVYGGGTLDGNGQVWYDLYAEDIYILRPILFGTIGLHKGSISNLNLRYSPQWYNFVANSTNVVFSDISISSYSKSNNTAKNTDGWDTYRSDSITIQNSVVNNGDDCVSFKPNSTNILVQNMHCNGSHGISVGSLGQYANEIDIVSNILVTNINMSNATDGARIKVWPGNPAALSGDLQGGGGGGVVKNVTYDGMQITNVDYAIEVTQCYGQKNETLCFQNPSSLRIEDITFKNIHGTTSGEYAPLVGTIVCSSDTTCSNIRAEDIDVVGPSGSDEFACLNVDDSLLIGLNCSAVTSQSN